MEGGVPVAVGSVRSSLLRVYFTPHKRSQGRCRRIRRCLLVLRVSSAAEGALPTADSASLDAAAR